MNAPVKPRGRFAPSPTGPLHFGSVVAALASYLDARAAGGEWIVRMEDIDESRTVPGAADCILRTLEALGFEWDGPVLYQTSRKDAYRAELDRLRNDGWAFGCQCSRAQAGSGRYPGTCRPGAKQPRAWRVRTECSGTVCFHDRVQGQFCQDVDEEVGDFVVLRADGLFAYQLAVVVDDAAQGITDVVRGADLLDSTPRQIWLQQRLGYHRPSYLHTPVAVNEQGQKLSKQTLAPAVQADQALNTLKAALGFLGHSGTADDAASIAEFWIAAKDGWSAGRIPRVRELLAPL